MTHVTCRLTAKNRYQLRDPTLGNHLLQFRNKETRLTAVGILLYFITHCTVNLRSVYGDRKCQVQINTKLREGLNFYCHRDC